MYCMASRRRAKIASWFMRRNRPRASVASKRRRSTKFLQCSRMPCDFRYILVDIFRIPLSLPPSSSFPPSMTICCHFFSNGVAEDASCHPKSSGSYPHPCWVRVRTRGCLGVSTRNLVTGPWALGYIGVKKITGVENMHFLDVLSCHHICAADTTHLLHRSSASLSAVVVADSSSNCPSRRHLYWTSLSTASCVLLSCSPCMRRFVKCQIPHSNRVPFRTRHAIPARGAASCSVPRPAGPCCSNDVERHRRAPRMASAITPRGSAERY